jgi:hypothetical protein
VELGYGEEGNQVEVGVDVVWGGREWGGGWMENERSRNSDSSSGWYQGRGGKDGTEGSRGICRVVERGGWGQGSRTRWGADGEDGDRGGLLVCGWSVDEMLIELELVDT